MAKTLGKFSRGRKTRSYRKKKKSIRSHKRVYRHKKKKSIRAHKRVYRHKKSRRKHIKGGWFGKNPKGQGREDPTSWIPPKKPNNKAEPDAAGREGAIKILHGLYM
jgi:hypothetical protein